MLHIYRWTAISHPDRLKYPLVRKNGKLERVSWDEAMNVIVQRVKQTQARLSNHGIGFYTSGQLFLEEYFILATIGKAGLNTLHMCASYHHHYHHLISSREVADCI